MTAQQTYDANDILMGGGGPQAWKFDEPGTTRTGTIAAPPIARQEREYEKGNPGGGALKVFPSGDPIMGILIEVATDERDPSNTDDDGKRTFYVEGRYIKEAVRNAVRAAGATKLEVGSKLKVTFTHREDPMDKRSRKYWAVEYTPAASAALMGDTAPTTPAPQQQPTTTPPVTTPAADAGPAQPSAEQLAAVRSAGVDPKAAFPHWNGQG